MLLYHIHIGLGVALPVLVLVQDADRDFFFEPLGDSQEETRVKGLLDVVAQMLPELVAVSSSGSSSSSSSTSPRGILHKEKLVEREDVDFLFTFEFEEVDPSYQVLESMAVAPLTCGGGGGGDADADVDVDAELGSVEGAAVDVGVDVDVRMHSVDEYAEYRGNELSTMILTRERLVVRAFNRRRVSRAALLGSQGSKVKDLILGFLS